jgi:hypothetical protein
MKRTALVAIIPSLHLSFFFGWTDKLAGRHLFPEESIAVFFFHLRVIYGNCCTYINWVNLEKPFFSECEFEELDFKYIYFRV